MRGLMMSNYKEGDLYWQQLSMWDLSKKDNVDTYNDGGFHYELILVTETVGETRRKIRNVKVGELTTEQIDSLKPLKGHNWHRVMGNVEDFK